MKLADALEKLGKEHKGKRIEMANRFGYWWNYWSDEVKEIRTTNKYIYVTLKQYLTFLENFGIIFIVKVSDING